MTMSVVVLSFLQ